MDWTSEKTGELKRLVAEGLSATQIGTKLSITRNAVIGKVHRLGIQLKQKGGGVRGPRMNYQRKPRAVIFIEALTREQIVPPPGNVKNFLELKSGDCRWPMGHGEHCSGVQIANGPYCDAHTVMGLRDGVDGLNRLKRKAAYAASEEIRSAMLTQYVDDGEQ